MEKLKQITLGESLKIISCKYPERKAVEECHDSLTYRELDFLSDCIAANLTGMGVHKGERFLLWSDNSLRSIVFFYALQKIGAIPVFSSHRSLADELIQQIETAEVQYFAAGEGEFSLPPEAMIRTIRGKKGLGIRHYFSLGKFPLKGTAGFSSLIREPDPQSIAAFAAMSASVIPEDTSMILFTSGTTGEPKAVMTSHFSRYNNGFLQARDLDATEGDKFCAVLPVFHCFGISTNVIAAMSVGACLHLTSGRSSVRVLESIQDSRCTILNAVPTIFHKLITCNSLDQYDISSLRTGFIGGAGCPVRYFREFERKLGLTLLSSLGMTETTAGITVSRPGDSIELRASTVGRFMEGVEGQIQDPLSRQPVGIRVIGEICVRGYMVMQGYYNNPGQTARVIDEKGWLHTGDLGYLDESGYLHLKGRLKELVIKGGENISPREIERVLLNHDKVQDAKVLGVPDPHYGEEIFAFVVPEKNSAVTLNELNQYCRERLIKFKVPRYIVFVQDLPRNPNGKVLLQELEKKALFFLESATREKARYYE